MGGAETGAPEEGAGEGGVSEGDRAAEPPLKKGG